MTDNKNLSPKDYDRWEKTCIKIISRPNVNENEVTVEPKPKKKNTKSK